MIDSIAKRGRPKGTPNKTTNHIRVMLADFLSRNWDRLQTDFDQITPYERLTFVEKLLRHILPAPVQVSFTEDDPERITGFTIQIMDKHQKEEEAE